MTTDNDNLVELPDRDVSELLELDTYQGMTDSEIQSIIDYRTKAAFESALTTEQIAIHTAHMQSIVEQNQRNAESLQSMVESLVSYMPVMGVIDHES